MRKVILLFLLTLSGKFLFAQQPEQKSLYDPHDFFVEEFRFPTANEFRSSKGVPGHSYWQNRANYTIHVSLQEKNNLISGHVVITYFNNSPDALDYLWLQLDQNILDANSRAVATTEYTGSHDETSNPNGGYKLADISVTQQTETYPVTPLITDTRMQIFLKKPMKPKGDSLSISMNFSFPAPQGEAGRFGKLTTKTGVLYQIAQFYPRMCKYDDVDGWNTLPYLGQGEFYLDFGDFDYYVTAPADMIVLGSGDLQNPNDVLSADQIKRLDAASRSDKTVMIIAPEEAKKTRPATLNEHRTWHYKIANAREVAWMAGRNIVWDAARANVPSGRKVLAMSAYPLESVGDSAWSRGTEYLKGSIEIYSKRYYEYPWNNAVNSGGITDGMEYPGIIFNSYDERTASLWFIVAHEIGHNWYPMIVGTNERKYMWQDEGLNTFINFLATKEFNNGEFVNHPYFRKKGFFASKDYQEFMHYDDPLMTQSDAMNESQHFQYYGRTAYGLDLLRDVILGQQRFDTAFRKYTEAWAFKHPTPYDFFNAMNNAGGEDLNWFWKGWFFTNWKLDQAITKVAYVNNDPAKGSLITITNNDKMIMPVIVKIVQANGREEVKTLPVEIWQRNKSWTFKYDSNSKIKQVILDPEKVLPDMDRSNNEWRD